MNSPTKVMRIGRYDFRAIFVRFVIGPPISDGSDLCFIVLGISFCDVPGHWAIQRSLRAPKPDTNPRHVYAIDRARSAVPSSAKCRYRIVCRRASCWLTLSADVDISVAVACGKRGHGTHERRRKRGSHRKSPLIYAGTFRASLRQLATLYYEPNMNNKGGGAGLLMPDPDTDPIQPLKRKSRNIRRRAIPIIGGAPISARSNPF
jgi:hypothetical protein